FVPDNRTLSSCALAGSILRRSSQRIIFDDASFGLSSERWNQFSEALKTPSGLGQHVQSITVRAAILTDETILSIFSKTSNLNSLDISLGVSHEESEPPSMPWTSLHIHTKRLLLDNVFPHLTYLRLWGLHDIPAIIFESLSSLQVLDCSESIVPLNGDVQMAATACPRPLVELHLHKPVGPSNNNVMPLIDYLARYTCRLRELYLEADISETSSRYIMKL
ncbi:hypothetical protein DL96DRAFT_1630085, partial [Flagelloscypha sp. PMI_526]